jgi:5'-nucleotidase
MAVMAAHLEAFGPRPDLVASGINFGANTGRSVLFSGTVGAALAAANFGITGVAVSQQIGEPWLVETAAAVGAAAVAWAASAPRATVVNVNVPNLAIEDLAGVSSGRLAPFGTVRTVFEGEAEGRLQLVLRETEDQLDPDTDTMLVLRGFVSVNALVGPRVADHGDLAEALTRHLLSRA